MCKKTSVAFHGEAAWRTTSKSRHNCELFFIWSDFGLVASILGLDLLFDSIWYSSCLSRLGLKQYIDLFYVTSASLHIAETPDLSPHHRIVFILGASI
jgi:hypothetical protein